MCEQTHAVMHSWPALGAHRQYLVGRDGALTLWAAHVLERIQLRLQAQVQLVDGRHDPHGGLSGQGKATQGLRFAKAHFAENDYTHVPSRYGAHVLRLLCLPHKSSTNAHPIDLNFACTVSFISTC